MDFEADGDFDVPPSFDRVLTEKCGPGWWSSRVQPRFDCLTCHWGDALAIPCRKLRALHLCPKDPASKEKEAHLQEEDEERTTEARHISSRRIDVTGCIIPHTMHASYLEFALLLCC